MLRRPLIIVGIVVAVLLIAVALYFLFFRNSGIAVDPGGGDPFDGGGDYVPGPDDDDDYVPPGGMGVEVAPNLFKITDGPVAYGALALSEAIDVEVSLGTGSTTIIEDGGTATEVRYVERETGNVYAYHMNERTSDRLSNRTLPGTEDATWAPNGGTVFVRFLSETEGYDARIETYALPVGGSDEGFLLEPGISSLVVTGSSTLVTLLPSSTGSLASASQFDGSGRRAVFSSPLASLRLGGAGASLLAFSKPSAYADGYGFLVSGGIFDRLLGPAKSLTLLASPSGKTVLYSSRPQAALEAGLLDVATRNATDLPIAALPEKCVWAADETALYCAVPRAMAGVWPDDWYQGAVSFSDRIWKIDLAARSASLIVDPSVVGEVDIDAVALTIDPRSDVLVFTNRKDGSLWAFDL